MKFLFISKIEPHGNLFAVDMNIPFFEKVSACKCDIFDVPQLSSYFSFNLLMMIEF